MLYATRVHRIEFEMSSLDYLPGDWNVVHWFGSPHHQSRHQSVHCDWWLSPNGPPCLTTSSIGLMTYCGLRPVQSIGSRIIARDNRGLRIRFRLRDEDGEEQHIQCESHVFDTSLCHTGVFLKDDTFPPEVSLCPASSISCQST